MEKILKYISKADADMIPELLKAVLERYNEVFSDWEISTIATYKDGTACEQISRMMAILDGLREDYKEK